MDPYDDKQTIRHKRSRPAFFLLVLMGCAMIFFALALIACAFVINYADDFEVSGGGGLEAEVQAGFNYSQYWAGIPFIFTGLLVLFSGVWQRSRGLTITTVVFCYISVALTLLVLAVESGSFYTWNHRYRVRLYWDAKSGYSCSTSTTKACQCTKSGLPGDLYPYECDVPEKLSALYGVVIGSAVIVALFCLFSVTIITKSMTWKRLRYVQHMYYPDEFYMNRRQPSVVEVPEFGREPEYADKYAGPPRQVIYKNYPY